ncbi:MAG: AlpA family phage regulatory protein [Gallionellaceae bacterium]|jgi:prophage regulatory protein
MQTELTQKPTTNGHMTDFLLPRKTVEKLSGLSRATIYRLMKIGKFPNSVSIGTGAVRWRQSDVMDWQMSLPSTKK